MAGEKRNKGCVSEEDVSLLLQRYNPTVVLTLLHEVFQVAGPKIDWNALVKRTATGITSAREYQMLWRHLAYCHSMEEKLEDGAEPLDDDSDLEFQLEISHGGNDEALNEAATCVKALISSSLTRESGLTNRATVAAPLTSNMSNDQTFRVSAEKQQMPRRGINISVPGSGQKHPFPRAQSAEGLDGNVATGSDAPSKKKRKLWTKEEDNELIAAVQKFGEGNWATIVKCEFIHNRTPSQLSQRWAIIRKKDGNLLAGSGSKSAGFIMQTEERLATQKAISLALGNPKSGRIASTLAGTTQSLAQANSLALSAALADTVPGSGPHSLMQASALGASHKLALNQLNKGRTIAQKQLVQVSPSLGPNPSIKAAAFAAGGRIATPSTAASLFKAAQSKNVVHIRPGGGVRVNSPATTVTTSLPNNTAGNANVTPISATAPASASSVAAPSSLINGTQGLSGKPASTADNSSVATTRRVSLGSSSNPTLHERTERSTDVSPNDVDELLIEEAKGSDELEIDDTVTLGCQTIMSQVNPGVDGKSVSDNSSERRAIFGKQKLLLNAQGLSTSEPNRIPYVDSMEVQNHVAQEQFDAGEMAQNENEKAGV